MRAKWILASIGGFAIVSALTAVAIRDNGKLLASADEQAPTHAPAQPATLKTPPDEWVMIRRVSRKPVTARHIEDANRAAAQIGRLAAARIRGGDEPEWQFFGPSNIGGRILDIAVDPLSEDTLYVASASGGVWKSGDAAVTFEEAWPRDNAQAVGALAITSAGRLYAGTGEAGPGGGSLTFGASGIFVSDDGAANWAPLGLAGTERISRIALDPQDETRVFVAATGPLYRPGPERGIYRSTDAGDSWDLVLAGENDTTGASDVHIDPTNSDRVYAVMWQHLREPARRQYGGVGSGIFRSDDGGESWQRLGGAGTGLPSQGSDVGRIGFGMAPSNPQRLYAIYIDAVGFFTGFYTSADGGDNWVQQPFNFSLSNSQSSFGWWFARIWVDPLLEGRVYVAGISLMQSNDGGIAWGQASGVHADQHAMAWDHATPGRVYLGNDGGVYRSNNNGTGAWNFASFQPWTQFYTLDVGEQDPSRVVAGAQDNGCNRSYTSANPAQWNSYGCGDGLETLINPVNQNIVYGCSQYGSCNRSTNGGTSSSSIGSTVSQRRNWLTPLVFDPNDPNIMYYAGNIVNRSITGSAPWTAISPDLTDGDPFPDPSEPYPFGTVTTVAPTKTDGNVLYAGTDDAKVWYTHDLGVNWTQSTDPDLPARWVTKIVADPTDAMVAYASFSGFREGDDGAYVFRTADGGASWTDISNNLPPAPVNAMALIGPGRPVVASDIGMFYSDNDGANWKVLGTGLPMAPAFDLRIHAPSERVYVATFGRGVWFSDLPASDVDDDGVEDTLDNCMLAPNPSQCNTDGDAYGNHCDPDLDNSGSVDFVDLGLFKAAFLAQPGDANWNPDADLDCSDAVNFIDLGIMKSKFFGPPGRGPSGKR